ncbi:DUF3325 domain-containing protein [Novosphingobium sp. KA1]|uniref:DUF3325 domain-containing protein n=1 Tax=Novosphingobium sp. (strain KA1) TaxID=164608 RepID=UPI001A8CF845|nr:DUF3325 domain-containing protein [Novosphingobium sp. KA1]QSR19940.1 hypothetical protein CA833_22595 [Novosphingobium sp. KA1]
MIHFTAILLALGGFSALALSMTRHQRDLVGRTLAARQATAARISGWVLLVSAFAVDVTALGGGYGSVACFAHLSVGAWLTIALLHWRRR